MARTVISSSMENDLRKHENQIRRCTARVKDEVDTAHMQSVHIQLAAIGSIIDASPTPRYMELPVIRIIPHSRNKRFFGRRTILDGMHEKLVNSDSSQQRKFALTGMAGSGKTQIALEYTYSHLEEYRVVIWILADSWEKIGQGFGDAAELMGMPKGTQSAHQIRAFVLQRLTATGK